MAKSFATGRPIKPLVLKAQERAYLERQVRRHRVARSLSERCRIIRANDPCNRIGRLFLGVGGMLVYADRRRVDHLDVAVISL